MLKPRTRPGDLSGEFSGWNRIGPLQDERTGGRPGGDHDRDPGQDAERVDLAELRAAA
jgi:hypothetical protein